MVALATLLPLASILRILFTIVSPVIVATYFIGAYMAASKTFDVRLVLALRLKEYWLGSPIAPIVLATVIGDRMADQVLVIVAGEFTAPAPCAMGGHGRGLARCVG